MKNLILDHANTPIRLKELNAQIVALFSDESIDESALLKLIDTRDVLIREHLNSCDVETQKVFAKAELEINGLLVACTKELSKTSLKQLSDLIRGRKAVKKYL